MHDANHDHDDAPRTMTSEPSPRLRAGPRGSPRRHVRLWRAGLASSLLCAMAFFVLPPAEVRSQTVPATPAAPNAGAAGDVSGIAPAVLGPTYAGSMTADGFVLPLPTGRWAVLTKTDLDLAKQKLAGTAYFLGRIEHKRLIGAVRIFALKSTDAPGHGFPPISGCTKGNRNLNYVRIDAMTPFGHEACWTVSNYFTPPWRQWADASVELPDLDRRAAKDMAAKGIAYPQDFVAVRFTRAEKWGLLEVSYLFDPETEGITSNRALSVSDSDWHVTHLAKFPKKSAYVAGLEHWGIAFWPIFQQVFAAGRQP